MDRVVTRTAKIQPQIHAETERSQDDTPEQIDEGEGHVIAMVMTTENERLVGEILENGPQGIE